MNHIFKIEGSVSFEGTSEIMKTIHAGISVVAFSVLSAFSVLAENRIHHDKAEIERDSERAFRDDAKIKEGSHSKIQVPDTMHHADKVEAARDADKLFREGLANEKSGHAAKTSESTMMHHDKAEAAREDDIEFRGHSELK